jgi:bifunctional non-homologous end joining protein LigD
MAVAALPARSCLIDGEIIVCNENGLAVFDRIRGRGTLADAVHCSFDLLELDGENLRCQPIEERKELLAELLHRTPSTIVVNNISRATARCARRCWSNRPRHGL